MKMKKPQKKDPDTAQHKDIAEQKRRYYTYMVRCSDGSYYTGYTTDLGKRVASHNAGSGAKYTKSRRPVQLIYSETYETKHDAMSREAKIKQLSHREKEQLITGI